MSVIVRGTVCECNAGTRCLGVMVGQGVWV